MKPPALKMALAFGVTTELDMFSDPAWMIEQRREAQRSNDMADVRSAMIGATVVGGHATGFVGPFFDDQFPVLESAHAADAFVLDRVGEGADYIQVMLEDGSAFGPTFPDLTDDMVTAVIEAAHRHGLMARAHAFTLHGALLAVRARVSTDWSMNSTTSGNHHSGKNRMFSACNTAPMAGMPRRRPCGRCCST